MATRIFGVVLLLGAAGSGFFAYLQAGGAWGTFRFDNLFEGDAATLTYVAGGLLFLGLLTTIFGGPKKRGE